MLYRLSVAALMSLAIAVGALSQPARAIAKLVDELYSTLEVSWDGEGPSDEPTITHGGPSVAWNRERSALTCTFALISNQGDYYSMAYVARWWTPNRGSQ